MKKIIITIFIILLAITIIGLTLVRLSTKENDNEANRSLNYIINTNVINSVESTEETETLNILNEETYE